MRKYLLFLLFFNILFSFDDIDEINKQFNNLKMNKSITIPEYLKLYSKNYNKGLKIREENHKSLRFNDIFVFDKFIPMNKDLILNIKLKPTNIAYRNDFNKRLIKSFIKGKTNKRYKTSLFIKLGKEFCNNSTYKRIFNMNVNLYISFSKFNAYKKPNFVFLYNSKICSAFIN